MCSTGRLRETVLTTTKVALPPLNAQKNASTVVRFVQRINVAANSRPLVLHATDRLHA
jgi:hypothetical protein